MPTTIAETSNAKRFISELSDVGGQEVRETPPNKRQRVHFNNDVEVNLHLGSYSGDWLTEDSIDYGASISKAGFTFGASATDLDGGAGDVKVYVAYSVDIDL